MPPSPTASRRSRRRATGRSRSASRPARHRGGRGLDPRLRAPRAGCSASGSSSPSAGPRAGGRVGDGGLSGSGPTPVSGPRSHPSAAAAGHRSARQRPGGDRHRRGLRPPSGRSRLAVESPAGLVGLAIVAATYFVLATPLLTGTSQYLLPPPWPTVTPWLLTGATQQALAGSPTWTRPGHLALLEFGAVVVLALVVSASPG